MDNTECSCLQSVAHSDGHRMLHNGAIPRMNSGFCSCAFGVSKGIPNRVLGDTSCPGVSLSDTPKSDTWWQRMMPGDRLCGCPLYKAAPDSFPGTHVSSLTVQQYVRPPFWFTFYPTLHNASLPVCQQRRLKRCLPPCSPPAFSWAAKRRNFFFSFIPLHTGWFLKGFPRPLVISNRSQRKEHGHRDTQATPLAGHSWCSWSADDRFTIMPCITYWEASTNEICRSFITWRNQFPLKQSVTTWPFPAFKWLYTKKLSYHLGFAPNMISAWTGFRVLFPMFMSGKWYHDSKHDSW